MDNIELMSLHVELCKIEIVFCIQKSNMQTLTLHTGHTCKKLLNIFGILCLLIEILRRVFIKGEDESFRSTSVVVYFTTVTQSNHFMKNKEIYGLDVTILLLY